MGGERARRHCAGTEADGFTCGSVTIRGSDFCAEHQAVSALPRPTEETQVGPPLLDETRATHVLDLRAGLRTQGGAPVPARPRNTANDALDDASASHLGAHEEPREGAASPVDGYGDVHRSTAAPRLAGRPRWPRRQLERGERARPISIATIKHRDDLQGLRAVAVLLVVLAHGGVGFLQGGFVGVDVFFVLSGFLITGLLLSGAAKNGFVSLAEFYMRRARRILPAAALTLVTTIIVSYQLLNFVRAEQVVWDSIWASFFAANIHFAEAGTDYFGRGQPASPIQHFWTLAVEEQFYVVWPALLSLVLFGGVAARQSRRQEEVTEQRIRRLLMVVVLAGIASLGWSIYATDVLPTSAFFSTFARAWELALGAALALAAPRLMHLSDLWRAVVGCVGLIAISVAAVMFSSRTPFPGYAALLPTVGAALVITAGIGDRQARLGIGRLLSLGPMRYVGDRSYAFYLWHWPVLIIAEQYVVHSLGLGAKLLLLAGAFGLSILSYALFENPIRRARSAPLSALMWPASVGAVAVVAVFTLHSIDAKASRLEASSAAAERGASYASSEQAIVAAEAGRALPAVVTAVTAARRGARIPSGLSPPVGDLLTSKSAFYYFPAGCSAVTATELSSRVCRFGMTSSAKSLVVIGDSHAQMWMPTLVKLAQRDGWVLIPLVKSGCSPSTWIGDLSLAQCRVWSEWAVRQAKSLRPHVTLIAGGYGGRYGETAAGVKLGIVWLTNMVKPFSRRVVVVEDDVGVNRQPVDCLLDRKATLRTCTTRWPDSNWALNDEIARLSRRHGFGFVKTRGFFCYENECPIVIGRTIAYRDLDHITKPYALQLAAPFRAAFRLAVQNRKARVAPEPAARPGGDSASAGRRGGSNAGSRASP